MRQVELLAPEQPSRT